MCSSSSGSAQHVALIIYIIQRDAFHTVAAVRCAHARGMVRQLAAWRARSLVRVRSNHEANEGRGKKNTDGFPLVYACAALVAGGYAMSPLHVLLMLGGQSMNLRSVPTQSHTSPTWLPTPLAAEQWMAGA